MALRDYVNVPWGRTEPPSRELVSALADLERLIRTRPELESAGSKLGRLLSEAFVSPVPLPRMEIDTELLAAAWQAGVPAFRSGEGPLQSDGVDLQRRILGLAEILRAENPDASKLIDAIRSKKVDLLGWSRFAIEDQLDALDESARAAAIDPRLARAVLRLALLPSLALLSERLAVLRTEGVWNQGRCPNCGSAPRIAESRGLEQRRYLRCGVCAADWPGPRIGCPHCGETNHHRLHYRFAESERDRYRLGLCDSCSGSLIVVSTLHPLSAPALLVTELATAHLESLSVSGDPRADTQT